MNWKWPDWCRLMNLRFELCWKTLKDKLVYDGYSVNSPREAIRQAFGADLIGHIDCWLQALESRNLS